MKWDELLTIVSEEPVFTSGMLLAGPVCPKDVRRQLSRWVKALKIIQLRRGVYTLAPPFRKTEAHPFLLANRLKRASYVSLQSGLSHHGLIPEYVPTVTSVTTGRSERVETSLGAFRYRHVQRGFFSGFSREEVLPGQTAFVAGPEKCLLDLVYFTPGGEREDYLEELRLQSLDRISPEKIREIAGDAKNPKLIRAAGRIIRLREEGR